MKRFFHAVLPLAVVVAIRALKYYRNGEPEVRWLWKLVDPSRSAIDVGANNGVYSWWLSRLCAHCYAFEPNPVFYKQIAANGRGVTASMTALSNTTGIAELFVPHDRVTGADMTGLATLEKSDISSGRSIKVHLASLDSLDMPPVGFIKIDVEGHEMEVLNGAMALIMRDRPVILVEAEERHRTNAVGSLIDWFTQLDMLGFWLKNGHWHSILEFDWQLHQKPSIVDEAGWQSDHLYFNNFVFVSEDRVHAYPFLTKSP